MNNQQRWYNRGYIPHFNSSEVIQFITYKLQDSIPPDIQTQIDALEKSSDADNAPFHPKIEKILGAGYGSCVLQQPVNAHYVIDTWKFHHPHKYHLFAWVVMPNHVHVLIKPNKDCPLSQIVQSWKSYTAKQIKKEQTNPPSRIKIWQRDYWDRFIRDEDDFYSTLNYIHENPVRAGLVESAKDWQYSSYHDWFENDDLKEQNWDMIFEK